MEQAALEDYMFQWNPKRERWETKKEGGYAGIIQRVDDEYYFWVTGNPDESGKAGRFKTTTKFRKKRTLIAASVHCAYMLGEARTHLAQRRYEYQGRA